jgi:hypothetical protein
VRCALQGVTAVLTWEPPEASAVPVVASVVERAVGKRGAPYEPAGRTEGGRFEQRVDGLAGQSVVYRVRAEDRGGHLGPWCVPQNPPEAPSRLESKTRDSVLQYPARVLTPS